MTHHQKFLSRRSLLKFLGASAAGQALLPHLRPTVAWAQGTPPLSGPIDIYIRVYFSGGVDGLTMVVPKAPTLHAALKAQRPVLMGPVYGVSQTAGVSQNDTGLIERPDQVLDIGQAWGLHPYFARAATPRMVSDNLQGIYELVGRGEAKVLSKVGFPAPGGVTGSASGPQHDLNHVTATDPWNIGKMQVDRANDLFWEVRLMQQAGMQWNQLWALGQGGMAVPLRPAPGGPSPTSTRFLSQVTKFTVSNWDGWLVGQTLGGESEVTAAHEANRRLLEIAREPSSPLAKRQYASAMTAALENAEAIQSMVTNTTIPEYFPQWEYPSGIGENFRDVARILSTHYLPSSQRKKLMLFIGLPGFDTHQSQDATLPVYLRGINHCIGALHRFLVENNIWSKTVIQFVSEFGRGIRSEHDGTPHGWGSMHFTLGGALNRTTGPIVGSLPTLSDITNPISVGPASAPESTLLAATLDPREVFYRVVEGMGFQASTVFPAFSPTSSTNLMFG